MARATAIVVIVTPCAAVRQEEDGSLGWACRDYASSSVLPLSDDELGSEDEREQLFELEDRLSEAVAALGGEHDGHEFGNGGAVLYTYGRDADTLLNAVRESVSGFPVRPGAYAIKRYGRGEDPDARQERVELS